jgi:tryptophan synthase alpha chain
MQLNYKHKLLIPYITVGDPSLADTEKLIYQFEKAGADLVELGIPFSDSLADGPTILASHQRALENGISLKKALALVKKVRHKTNLPLAFMLSVNLIYKFGVENFIAAATRAGLNGVIVPDLPPEEERSDDFKQFEESDLDVIYLVAPNTPEERIKYICDQGLGFIYLVSVAGVTGERENLSGSLKSLVRIIKKYTALPVCIGFGISSPKQARAAAKMADGVIVGSAVVRLLEEQGSRGGRGQKLARATRLVESLRKAID